MDLCEHVTAVLNNLGYSRFPNTARNDFRLYICTPPRQFRRTQIVVHDPVIQIFVFTDAPYLIKHQPWILEIVCRLNDAISVLGAFLFNWDMSSVLYKAATDIRVQQDTQAAITNAMNALVFPLHVWDWCFQYVGQRKPCDVVNAAMIHFEVGPEFISNATRRALFQIEK